MKVMQGETLEVRGTLDARSGTLLMSNGAIDRDYMAEEALTELPITLTELRVHDAIHSTLPGTAASDDLGLVGGTWGTNAPTVQSSDAKGTTVTQYARFRKVLGPEYISGQDVQLRIRAGMVTTVASTSAIVDVECYADNEDGAPVGSPTDLCVTAAQSINSLVKANKDFVITTTNLAPGVVLDFRVKIAITDSGTGTAVIGEISRISLLEDIRA